MVHGVVFAGIVLILALFGSKWAIENLTKGCSSMIFGFLVTGGIIAFFLNEMTSDHPFHFPILNNVSSLGVMIISFAISVLTYWRLYGVKKEENDDDDGCLLIVISLISPLICFVSMILYFNLYSR